MSNEALKAEIQEDITAIETKRQVLEQIVSITQSIENMHTGLESILVLGAPSQEMPEEALELYNSISSNLRNLPVNTIREYLRNLESLIRVQIKSILRYADLDLEEEDSVEILTLSSNGSGKSPLEELEEFKRTAQTAVSLKVLLRRRGVASGGCQFPVPREMISAHVSSLEQQEQRQRARIRGKVEEMKAEIAAMIDNPAYPDGLKSILRGVQDDLGEDLDRIDKGLKLSSLSFVTDAGELSAIDENLLEPAPQPVEVREPPSFTESANLWLNTSWDVSWKDVRKRP
ncbi:MAG: hypothetical protein KDI68_07570 [Gammaproteobacteria bacterium]|nr:hypothetical protein [Gammaproteobacteria bacterium]